MNRMVFCKRINALSLCCAFLTAVVTPHCLGANKPTIAGEEIDQSVIAALPHQGATKPKVISHIDLTEPFGTVTQWTFVAVQEGGHLRTPYLTFLYNNRPIWPVEPHRKQDEAAPAAWGWPSSPMDAQVPECLLALSYERAA
jgi:hypothetical protein